MKKKLKIILSSLSVATVLAASSLPFIISGINAKKNNDGTPGRNNIPLKPAKDIIMPSEITPASSSFNPATLIFSNANLQTPFRAELVKHLPQNVTWSLSNITATNIRNNVTTFSIEGQPLTFSTADLQATSKINGEVKIVNAKVSFDIQTQKYNIYTLNVLWNPMSNLTPGNDPWSKLNPADKPWSGFTPEDKPFSNLTPAENNLTPATLIFSNANLQTPFRAELVKHLPQNVTWSLSNITATNIRNNVTTFSIEGQPLTFSTADLQATSKINGEVKIVNAKVSFDIQTQKYTIYNLAVIWSSMSDVTKYDHIAASTITPASDIIPASNLTPEQIPESNLTPARSNITPSNYSFRSFEAKVKDDLKHHLSRITNTLHVKGNYNITWNHSDKYFIDTNKIMVNNEKRSISTTLTNDSQCQKIDIQITYHDGAYRLSDWITSSKPTSYYLWSVFKTKALHDLDNNTYGIIKKFKWKDWNSTDKIVIKKQSSLWQLYVSAILIDETTHKVSPTIMVYYHNNFHKRIPYNIDQWEQ